MILLLLFCCFAFVCILFVVGSFDFVIVVMIYGSIDYFIIYCIVYVVLFFSQKHLRCLGSRLVV